MKSKSAIDLPSLRDLLTTGAHFGHRRERSTPAAQKYTFVVRDGVAVINLELTQEKLGDAARLLESLASENKTALFVGTKRQARETVAAVAQKTTMPFVAKRWLGGSLTNFAVIRGNIQQMAKLEQTLANEKELAKFTKRERVLMTERLKKLHATFDGMASMTKLPDLLIVVDPEEEQTAVQEARRLSIPVMAICDTDTDPEQIDYPIPANDDAPKAIELILNFLGDALLRGQVKA